MSILRTIYSTEHSQNTLWREESPLHYPKLTKSILYRGLLTFKINNQTQTRLVLLTKTYLIYLENNKPFTADIKWTIISPFSETSQVTVKYGFTIQLSSSEKFDFYTQGRCELDQWLEVLSSVAVLDNFDEHFVILKKQKDEKNAEIFLCHNILTKHPFSVRRIKIQDLSNVRERNLVFNEVSIMRKMNHKSVARVLKVFEDSDFFYEVLDCLEFGTLEERTASSEQEIARFGKKFFKALGYIHSKGVIHRGINRKNVVMTDKYGIWTFKITGFRHTCHIGRSYKEKRTVFEENSPAVTTSLSRKNDVYQAGAIIYSLVMAGYSGEAVGRAENLVVDLNRKKLLRRISLAGYNFLCELLGEEPFFRPSASEAAEHEWFRTQALNMSRASIKHQTKSTLSSNHSGHFTHSLNLL